MSDINGDFISLPVEPRLSVYMHEKAARLGIPVSGNFELTSRCNFSCRMCYIHSDNAGKREKELSADDWLKIGRQAADAGVVFLLLTGGEPFLREDFSEIYSGLKKNGFMLSINTNGSLLNEELFKLFKKDPPSRLNISLYGTSDNAYENLCGSRSFSRVADNIEKAVRNGIQVKLNYSITPFNRGETEDIFRFARELGLPVQYSAYMYPRLRTENVRFGENGGRFSPEEAAACRAESELLYLGKERFIEKATKLESILDGYKQGTGVHDRRMHCRAGRSNCWVDWRGNMSVCGMIPSGENNVLNKGFSDCWESVKRDAARITLPEKCADCPYACICNVCAAVCMCETGRYHTAPDYVCRFSRLTCENMLRLKNRMTGGESTDEV